MKTYNAIGIMSGTSRDGMDIAHCVFSESESGWKFDIMQATTKHYPQLWKDRLEGASKLSGDQLMLLHMEYGHYIGKCIKDFITTNPINTKDLIIASHGHTVFHKPDQGYTFQLGHGAAIAASSGYTTIADFRSADVALGGQGAPLVPLADKKLFSDHDACLNLGGFTNISYEADGKRIAFDICPLNFVINHLVRKASIPASSFEDSQHQHQGATLDFDPSGRIAQSGNLDKDLLLNLNSIPYYHQPPPKSLGEEWVNEFILPTINRPDTPLEDILQTFYHHAASRIAEVVHKIPNCKDVLITGGGAYNKYFFGLLQEYVSEAIDLYIPEPAIIDYKEALIFAWLGVLCMRKEHNCLASVTGATTNCICGSIHWA